LQKAYEKGRILCRCGLLGIKGILPLRLHLSDVIDITTAQTDIVKLAVGKLAQSVAGHAAIIPVAHSGKAIGYRLNKTVGGDSAQRRRAGRVNGGHGGYPFLKLLIAWAFLPCDNQIILLHVQSKTADWQVRLARIA
jgi:hypothetical protein